MPDRIPMLVRIPPKLAVSSFMEYLKEYKDPSPVSKGVEGN